MTIDAKDLLNSIERASLLSQSEQNNLIKLSIRDSMMAITSNNEKGNVYFQFWRTFEWIINVKWYV